MQEQMPEVEFTIDINNLYKQESITDLKTATIRKMIPVKVDGSIDPDRSEVFYANTQLISPEGPVPLEAQLKGDTFEEAMESFPEVMQEAFKTMYERMMAMQKQQQQAAQQDQSRIIVPGR